MRVGGSSGHARRIFANDERVDGSYVYFEWHACGLNEERKFGKVLDFERHDMFLAVSGCCHNIQVMEVSFPECS